MTEGSDPALDALRWAQKALADAQVLVSRLQAGPQDADSLVHLAGCLEVARSVRNASADAAYYTLVYALDGGCPPALIDVPAQIRLPRM